MTTAFVNQLQPFEEQTSPSPVHEDLDPFDRLSLTRSRSPPSAGNTASASLQRGNSLHRQLSGDPESPPPAWKRRPSIIKAISPPPTSPPGQTAAAAAAAAAGIVVPPQAPSSPSRSRASSGGPPPSRRHHSLMMTSPATSLGRAPLPSQLFMHESSPQGSSTSLNEMDLPLPQPAFRGAGAHRSGRSSARSSIISSAELNSLTSEDLWTLGQETALPDMSNPDRQAAERPLDTVMGLGMREKKHKPFRAGLPVDVIWPEVSPADALYERPTRAKSYTNVVGLGQKAPLLGRKRTSRQPSVESINGANGSARPASMVSPQGGKTAPSSPSVELRRPDSMFLSSAHSSSTDLSASGGKVHTSLSRPPSTYYSRDFLSSLAPREGGYAIAAMMGGGLGAIGTMTVEEKRRSSMMEEHRERRPVSRAPAARSTGMGRWSLDGGEHYGNRPYGNPSPATTSSNLSTYPPVTSPDPSPPAEEALPASQPPSLPEGAMPSAINMGPAVISPVDAGAPPAAPVTNSSVPLAPSPLSRAVTQEQEATPAAAPPSNATMPAPPPIPVSAPAAPALTAKKSTKELKKEAKKAAQAQELKLAREAAAKKQAAKDEEAKRAREAAVKKQAAKEAEARAKVEAKRKEREEKIKRKADKAEKGRQASAQKVGSGASNKSSASQVGLAFPKALSLRSKPSTPNMQPAAQPAKPAQPSTPADVPAATPAPAPAPVAAASAAAPVRAAPAPPAAAPRSAPPPTSGEVAKRKLGFFGTMRKRFSIIGPSPSSASSSLSPSSSRAQSEPVVARPAAPAQTPEKPLPVGPLPVAQTPVATAAPAATVDEGAAPGPIPAAVLAPRTTSLATPTRPLSVASGTPSFATATSPSAARAGSSLTERASPARELHASGSIKRNRPSSIVSGPRPMPTGLARSISNASALSGRSAPSPTHHANPSAQAYPFDGLPAGAADSVATHAIAKTSSHLSSTDSANDNAMSSTMTTASSDLATPMFSSESESSQSSFTSVERDDPAATTDAAAAAVLATVAKDAPARENSNETIHANVALAPVAAPLAAH